MNACCVIPQQQWQKHCSVAELTAPFYFGMHSALGEEPAEVSKMTCSKSVCSMLHEVLDAELVEYADLLTWNPVEQIAMSNVYDIDRRLSSYDKIPGYLREDLSLSNTKKFWTSGVQVDMFLLHPESRKAIVRFDDHSYQSLAPGDLFFCSAQSNISFISAHAVLYRWLVYSLS